MLYTKLPRIYINNTINEKSTLTLEQKHSHYLKNVLRLKNGDMIKIFNHTDGEFIAQITNLTKSSISVTIVTFLRKSNNEPTLILGLCLIKADKMLDAINMAVQLGVTCITPIISNRSQNYSINIERFERCIIEATEQCGRLTPPTINNIVSLKNYLDNQSDTIIFANSKENYTKTIREIEEFGNIVSVLIGPEGGFSSEEIKMITSHSHTKSISISYNILRAETAVSSTIAQIQLMRQKI